MGTAAKAQGRSRAATGVAVKSEMGKAKEAGAEGLDPRQERNPVATKV